MLGLKSVDSDEGGNMITNLFHRIWTAIVATITGAVLGLVATIVMAQQHIMPVDMGLNAVWILSAAGFVLGLLFGGRSKAKNSVDPVR
jgi:hypothetical protein